MELPKELRLIKNKWNAGKPVTPEERWLYKEWIFNNVDGEGAASDKAMSDAITPDSVEELNYKVYSGKSEKALPSSIKPGSHKHHKLPKKEVYKLYRRAWQLEGRAGVEKVEALTQQFGLSQAGSGTDALVGLPVDFHQGLLHRAAKSHKLPGDSIDIPEAVSNLAGSEISGDNLKLYNQELNKLSNIDELLDYAENKVIPDWSTQQQAIKSIQGASDLNTGKTHKENLVEVQRQHNLREAKLDNQIDNLNPSQIVEKKGSGLTRLTRAATGVADDVFKASTSTVLGAVIDPAVHQKFKEGDYIGVGKEAVKGAAIGGLVERTVSGLSRLIPAAAAIGTTKVLAGVGALAAAEQLIAPQGFADGTLDAHKERLEQEQDPFRN